MTSCGSSPRVWGKQGGKPAAEDLLRFIPTGVGKTPTPTQQGATAAVHPHGCGENASAAARASSAAGSSPRVWGKLSLFPLTQPAGKVHPHGCGENQRRRSSPFWVIWFIPTGVGKTRTGARSPGNRSVHPHGCGENPHQFQVFYLPYGSSPRVWGKLLASVSSRMLLRFIPTGVGKTLARISLTLIPAVHPHGCGENDGVAGGPPAGGGSSPRVWGKP